MKLVCANCKSPLTGTVRWGNEGDYGIVEPAPWPGGGKPVPKGLVIRLAEAWRVECTPPSGESYFVIYSPAGAIAANPDDIIDGTLESCGIDNGCCGSDGADGANRACICGAVLGTEWSDCWTQAEIRFGPEAVEEVEA